MYTIILLGPIFIFFLCVIFGRYLGSFYTAMAVSISTAFSAIIALDGLYTELIHAFNLVYVLPFFNVFEISWITVGWHFYFDQLTITIFCLVTIVSFFIQLFATAYMGEDASQVRFIIYLCFFIIAIIILVGSINFLQLFLGWELVGLASFLLINFWFGRQDANIAAFKALAINRVGDGFLFFSILLFLFQYNTFDFDLLFILSTYDSYAAYFAFSSLIIAAFAKSAQFFFHSWLPDAMEGPTPVSALLHSATMVTAGVFLILRFMDILELFPSSRFLLILFGLLTAFYAMSIGAVADDTKRVTAYTTLNQLGFIFFGCGSLAFSTVLFHLIIHGFYKSFSFLSAALELHDFEDEQDGEFSQLENATSTSYYDLFSTVVFFSINAIPFTAPSLSKEFILLAGLEKVPEYFAYIVTIILFSSYVSEGRDDLNAESTYTGYYEDLYVNSSAPYIMLAGCSSLGCISIFSALFLEELFLDMNTYTLTSFDWLDMRGCLLLLAPFISFILAEFFFSGGSLDKLDDISKTSVIFRSDTRYQAILFNAELWFYDEFIVKVSSIFYAFSGVFTNSFIDKGYLEKYYIESSGQLLALLKRIGLIIFSQTLEKVFVIVFAFAFIIYTNFAIFTVGIPLVILALFVDLFQKFSRSS